MDPDAVLDEIRDISTNWLAGASNAEPAAIEVQLGDLAEKVQALDQWLSKGGFLPTAWRR